MSTLLAEVPKELQGLTLRGQIDTIRAKYKTMAEIPSSIFTQLVSVLNINSSDRNLTEEQINQVHIRTGHRSRQDFKIEFRGTKKDAYLPLRKDTHWVFTYEKKRYYGPIKVNASDSDVYVISFYKPVKYYSRKKFKTPKDKDLWFNLAVLKKEIVESKIIHTVNPYSSLDQNRKYVKNSVGKSFPAISMPNPEFKKLDFGDWYGLYILSVNAKK